MSAKKTIVLSADCAAYFDGTSSKFGSGPRDAFSSAEPDMDEAEKCYALNRYTACVFHLMRVLESGLTSLGSSLGLSVAPNWNTAINEIEREIRSRSVKTHGASWREDEIFYTEAAVHFRMVKNAWRNHTMHLKERYDEERAKSVLHSVADFMSHLSVRLSETV